MDIAAPRTLVPRTIGGSEALVSTDPGEIFLDLPARSPRYIRVREGEIVQEGDVQSHDKREMESTSLQKWTIDAIGSDVVVGSDTATGERREWDRESLEEELGTGALSTDLTDFERVSVIETGGEGVEDDPLTVTAIVYGNDGTKFARRYRFAEDGEHTGRRPLVSLDADRRTDTFDDALRERFDRAVKLALHSEGYAV